MTTIKHKRCGDIYIAELQSSKTILVRQTQARGEMMITVERESLPALIAALQKIQQENER